MTPLERLRQRRDTAQVDLDGAVAFTREEAPGVMLLPGDPARPEVIDLAVVLGELRALHPGLRFAVAADGDEGALRARLPVTTFPSLVLVRGGAVAKVLSRMQSWATYDAAIAALGAEP